MDDDDDDAIEEISTPGTRQRRPEVERDYIGSKGRWTCRLCSQTRNIEGTDKCITCGRIRGHEPTKYKERLKEIRRYSPHNDYDDPDEELSWTDYWGLIVGLILIVLITALLVWAYLEDQKEQVRDELDL
eukprot:gnl/TRDRNA2_/TRDRNA2_46022_c0_seq1.p1 gnl/TRDRNA2_/TRDRNA2_46022_c0~~gnl/TRDRNA2_/TRDRNA2_46022_c0_seq1.p1  ORF type:complete len:143 (-),score=16.98 gnl/TRDRNA2_/TRDRNA2_46022_c0_seq1:57-446(-)